MDWHTYYNNDYTNRNTYLTRIDDETHLYYPNSSDPLFDYKYNTYQGFFATFVVTGDGVTNARNLQILPRLIKSYDGSIYEYWLPNGDTFQAHMDNYQINVNVDNLKPTAPELDTTKSLGASVNSKQWFTDNNSFTLDYQYVENMDKSGISTEYVYAFIVDTNFSDGPREYDFTPGNGAEYVYTAGSQTMSARRYELGQYSNDANANKSKLSFDIAGEYGLVLYSVDETGNVSSPAYYTPSKTGKTVKVDASTKETGAYIKYGSNPDIVPTDKNSSEILKYANIYVLVGDSYHDAYGNCTFDVNNTQPNNAIRRLVSVKRGQFVTVRIVMSDAQTENYNMVRYAIGNSTSIDKNLFQYKEDRFGNLIVDVSYRTNDDIWNSFTDTIPIKAYFHRRVDIKLLDGDFTYTFENGNARKITFAKQMQAYFANPNETEVILVQPKIAVEYFKPVTLEIKSEYTTNDAGQTILQGGGSITIGGMVYDIGSESFNQNEFVRGNISFVVGGSEYFVKASSFLGFENDGGIEYRNYELTCYDLNAGNEEGYADAGLYFYRAYVVADDNTHYYGEFIDSYVIKKADPGVIDLFSKNTLTFGQSMEDLIFTSYDKIGSEIPVNRGLSINVQGNFRSYQQVSTGLYGSYVILDPEEGSDAYLRHKVEEDFKITVGFRPVDFSSLTTKDIQNNYEILKSFFVEVYDSVSGAFVGYALREGAQTAVNYMDVDIAVTVTVVHKTATVIALDSSLDVNYDGRQKEASAYVTTVEDGSVVVIENQPLIYEYKLRGADDSTYTKNAPEQAGQYTVRITIDTENSNYVSDYEIRDMIITKRELTISVASSVTNHTVLQNEISAGGVSSDEMLTYTYSHTQTASYISGFYEEGEFNQVGGLLYLYSFFKYGYYDQNSNLVDIDDASWSDPVDVIGSSSLTAGIYMMRVEINNQNNAGEKYIIVDVKQVRRGDGITSLSISTPSVYTNYELIDLDGTPHGTTGHLEYGQTLASMRDALLGNRGTAKYSPKGAQNPITINSRFIFETEEEYVERIFRESGDTEIFNMDINGYGQKVFPVRYSDTGAILPYSVRIIWQAGSVDEVNGVFVPNYNFRSEEIIVSIFVVRATVDFSNYSLSDITYGQKVSESGMVGDISSYGYVFGDSDFTVKISDETLASVPMGGLNDILVDFTPSEALLDKYLPLTNVKIPLMVNKREVKITFATTDIVPDDYDGNAYQNAVKQEYGKKYVAPEVSMQTIGINLSLQGVLVNYVYLRDYTEGEELGENESLYVYGDKTYVNIGAITPSTPVGKYYVIAEIMEAEQNFTGSSINTYFITKGYLYFNGLMPQMKIEYGDNINSVDFGSVVLANDPSGDATKSFNGVIAVAHGITDEEGNLIGFDYDYLPDVDLSGNKNVYLVFTPTGSETVVAEYENNYRPYVYHYPLIVDKRDLTGSIVVTDNLYQFDSFKKELNASVKDPFTGNDVEIEINYPTDATSAGKHPVEIRVKDSVENFKGSLIAVLTITKAPLKITNLSVETPYNAKDQAYKPEYQVDLPAFTGKEFEFELVYKDYLGNTLKGLPREIGFYSVYVTLVDDNFEEETRVDYYVTPNLKEYGGLNQVYSASGISAVTPVYNEIVLDSGDVINHPTVKYSVTYKDLSLGDAGDFVAEVPRYAGQYKVSFRFDDRGYIRVKEMDMIVEKAEAVFVVFDSYETVYIGEQRPLNVLLPESVTVAEYYYKSKGASDESYVTTAPINAGVYDVKIVLVDRNYKGEKFTTYVVNKGDLEVKRLPTVSSGGGNVHFNTPSEEVTFTYNPGNGTPDNLGDVQFPYDPMMVINGKWSLITDVSAYRVGERIVEIVFTPEDTNVNPVYATINVNVIQKDVSDLITFVDDFQMVEDNFVISYEFTADKIGVTPVLSQTLPYSDSLYFIVTYGDTTALPVNVLTESGMVVGYPVTVTVSDANYAGHIENVLLYITPAIELEVILPEFRTINVGDTLDNSYVIDATGGVYVRSSGKAIQGKFVIVEDYRVPMTKANMQKIEVQFMPSADANNVSSPRVNAYINVNGQTLDTSMATLSVTTNMVDEEGLPFVPYGAPLSSYQISIEGVDATVEWVNPDLIVNVGEDAEYIITPTDTDTYNIERRTVTLTPQVSASQIVWSAESYVVLYEGQALKEAIPYIKIYNAYLDGLTELSPEQLKKYEITDYEYTISGDNLGYVANENDLGNYLQDEIVITIIHPNYESSSQSFRVFVKRLIKDFNVANKQKYYDSEQVTISDLGISLVGTTYLPGEGDIIFKNIVLNGKSVAEIREAGTYTVTIAISEDLVGENGTELNGSHDGEYTFTYTILKRDLSATIDAFFVNALNERVEFSEGTIYAEYVEYQAIFVEKDEEGNVIREYDVDNSTVLFTHYSASMAYCYGSLPPTDAGEYKVVVSLRDNPYFIGSKTFDYFIQKRVADITLEAGYFFTYSPNGVGNINPYVSNNVSAEYVQITYYPDGSDIGTMEKPINVGSYKVVVNIVNHPNMTGTATTRLNITTAPVFIEELPVINQTIKYGVMLKQLDIEGGVAEATGGEVVDGKFSFMYPELNNLPVGINDVTLVFTPYNANYGTTTCVVPVTVTKAHLNVDFISLEAYYTGAPLDPEIKLDRENIKVSFSYKQGNLNLDRAINAGVYEVVVTIVDANYEGSTPGVFTIHKANVIAGESVKPDLSPITYGTAVNTGTISGGKMVYVSGAQGIYGTYRYVDEDTVLGDVGTYDDVQVIFTPADSANYESYVFGVSVEVVKANAVISVSANNFTYGEVILSPTFTTSPLGLGVDNSAFEEVGEGKTGIRGTVQKVGTYLFTAYINDKNYKGEITYAIVVNKKAISVAFYRDNTRVDDYVASYGNTYFAKAQIIADTLVGEDSSIKADLEKLIVYRYVEYNEDGK
ncbi:MAG: hypothetical protein IKB56_03245, partial [Clostridia bacterium]|nr:hypothetical protein [Clostridia bacterium]